MLRAAARAYHTKNCFGHRQLLKTHPSPVQQGVCDELSALVQAYRDHGYRTARLNPLEGKSDSPKPPILIPQYYGLDPGASVEHAPWQDVSRTVGGVVDHMTSLYSGTMSLDATAITDSGERKWVESQYEARRHAPLPPEQRLGLARLLIECEVLDHFLAKRFPSLKRYGAEGCESLLAVFSQLLSSAGPAGVRDIVIGMPHRGRLNLLTGLLGYQPAALFHKLAGNSEFPRDSPFTGDVPSHLVSSIDIGALHVSLLPNPSHLEAVNPVSMGKTRARELSLGVGAYSSGDQSSVALNVQVHGDAAFAAQGVIYEGFALSQHPHYSCGGTLHVLVDNQLGFTTPGQYGRSWPASSDVAKLVGSPVIHVNGDSPEDVLRATDVALAYQREFNKDVLVHLTCYRRWGHNELDNPSLTQPAMYETIGATPTLPAAYSAQLINEGVLSSEHAQNIRDKCHAKLQSAQEDAANFKPEPSNLIGWHWSSMSNASSALTHWDTGCHGDLLHYIGACSVYIPDYIRVFPRLLSGHVSSRLQQLREGRGIDWATAEALAMGSLLTQGFNVRLSGQDVGRGTFSHRHAMLVCQDSQESYIPLNNISPDQGSFLEIANSPLSEFAVLGFEYGFSIESPRHLVIWEAQFGDFFNGAQIVIDNFLCGGEAKWGLQSGLVLLLPHGFDGAGPDHSSCHVERFLQLTDSSEDRQDGDSVNMCIAHPTSPAQYFHLLRRQMLRNFRKPLIVQSPKILLRHPAAVSSLEDMAPGTGFQPVLPDPRQPSDVRRVVLCSGKHYYSLDQARVEQGLQDTALLRLELLCPLPIAELALALQAYPNASEFVWSQEEPLNMGAWSFVAPRVSRQLGIELRPVARQPCASTAVGVAKAHQQEAAKLLTDTFA